MIIIKRFFLIFVVLVSCVGCDQTTKSVAKSFLSERDVLSFFGDTVRLQLAHNHGAFLSMGASLPEVWRELMFTFGVGTMLLILFGYALFAKAASRSAIIAYALLLAGGIGNLIDRLTCGGYVVDFINIGIGSFRTGVFNVADIAVTAGALIFLAIKQHEQRKGF